MSTVIHTTIIEAMVVAVTATALTAEQQAVLFDSIREVCGEDTDREIAHFKEGMRAFNILAGKSDD